MNIKQKIMYLQEKYERFKPQESSGLLSSRSLPTLSSVQTDLEDYYTISSPIAHHLRA
ncbi:hypothetical protein J4444_05475 [Candidatus Woesearchaeota archaeon]|nr:hypothetical protein [Candidatus Woesearchaeota archaeon]